MMLPSNRLREIEFAARQRAGEDPWTDQVEDRALRRLDALWIEVARDTWGAHFSDAIATVLTREGGWSVNFLIEPGSLYALRGRGTEFVIDLLATVIALHHADSSFQMDVNRVLREHRISYVVVDAQLLPRSADELDQEVVHPAIGLLLPDRFAGARRQYMSAIKEIQRGDAGDAITDAAAALQEVFEALECEGNALGPLIRSARKKGLLAAHDTPLVEVIEKAAHWVSADRSETGDSHRSSSAEISDAWFIVHVVGALIVRLVDPGSTRAEEA